MNLRKKEEMAEPKHHRRKTGPTEQQMENAFNAGWDAGDPDDPDYPKEPPVGWDGHSAAPEIDPDLKHNGVPAPVPGDPDYTEGVR